MFYYDPEEEVRVKDHVERVAKLRASRRAMTLAERRWIARFKRVVAEMPTTLTVLADSQVDGATVFMDKVEEGYEVARAPGRIGSLKD